MFRPIASSATARNLLLKRNAAASLAVGAQARSISVSQPRLQQPAEPTTQSAPSNQNSGNGFSSTTVGLLTLLGVLGGAGAAYALVPSEPKDTFEKFGTPEDFKKAIAELKKILGEDKVSTEPDVLESHGFSPNSYHHALAHTVVVTPESTDDVVVVVKTANKYLMPIVAYSGGTSLEGHFSGHQGGGICIDMSNMNQIIHVNEEDMDAVVQPGVPWEELNEELKQRNLGMFFPLDPGPGATIGGMAGTGCSGTNAVKYGTAKSHWFLNLTVVLPNGEVIKTRSRSRKSSAGFDLTKLFIGAEGTLGIVTEATIRLTPLVPTSVAIVQFPDVKSATTAVHQALKSTAGDSLQCIELVDDHFMAATNRFGQSARKYMEKDSLFIKFQGSPSHIRDNARVVKDICMKNGSLSFDLARNDQEAHDLWQDRKNALWTSLTMVPGGRIWTTDVCVPVSRLPELVHETKKDLAESKIHSCIVGHVGDGNFHAFLVFKDDSELPRVSAAVHRMVERAMRLEGTCTGEHGVGIGKKEYLVQELGAGTVDVMKSIKRTLDPHGLFNPGKLYPDENTTPTSKSHH